MKLLNLLVGQFLNICLKFNDYFFTRLELPNFFCPFHFLELFNKLGCVWFILEHWNQSLTCLLAGLAV